MVVRVLVVKPRVLVARSLLGGAKQGRRWGPFCISSGGEDCAGSNAASPLMATTSLGKRS
jgi:hypothetical protein